MKKETRQIPFSVSGLHVREAEGENESRTIEGHAIVFGQRSVSLTAWSEIRDVYEVMERTSITDELIKSSDIVLTAFHNNELIMGRSTNGEGTLQLTIDDKGVMVRCELPKTQTADDMLELIKRGDISGMSFCYTCDEEDANCVSYEKIGVENGREQWLRHVHKCNGLYDVTIAGHPAYQQTDIYTREDTDQVDAKIAAQVEEAHQAEEAAKAAAEMEERDRQIEAIRRQSTLDNY